MSKRYHLDKPFLGIVVALVFVGIIVFISAALSVLTKNPSVFYRILATQLGFALVGGGAALYFMSRVPYQFWRKYALPLAVLGLLTTALVFIPGLGFSHNGAQRWISLGFISFQPSELLKFTVIIYWAGWLSWAGSKIKDWRYGLLPLGIISVLVGGLLLAQPDTGTLIVILGTMIILYFLAGAKIRDFFIIGAGIAIAATLLIASRPYLLDRIKTFSDPGHDPLGSSYQIQQSLIAIGSGQLLGRGYGQSVQKFNYLPEPIGDSVFAVYAEEFGFVGSILLLVLYLVFFVRGYRIAIRAPDTFAMLLVAGIISVIMLQSLLNIASTMGLFPLTGLPLVFISHGGTALFITLLAVGVVLQVSRYQKAVK